MADEVAPNVSDQAFPAVDVEKVLSPRLPVDPISSEIDIVKKIERKQDEVFVESQNKTEKKMAEEVAPNVSDQAFSAVDVEKVLSPPAKDSPHVDPISSEVDTVKKTERKQDEVVIESKSKTEKKDPLQTLKTAVIVSGVVVAVAGAIFAITRKLKEK